MARAVAMLSGGLDSQLAIRLMQEQGVEVEAVTSASVFHHARPELGDEHPAARTARRLGVPHTLLNTNTEMLELVGNPQFGRGKNMNPCIDCRMFLLRKAGERMRETGADFIVTGEVIGQRPMSQRRYAIGQIERAAGVDGLVVRPLCGKLLPPTIPEQKGFIDREKLLAIKGRSRKEQIALAQELGVTDYPSPAGGCLLTDPGFSARLRELIAHTELSLGEVELLRVGRHFRLGGATKLVVGRNQDENEQLERLRRPGDLLFDAADVPGPTALLRGEPTDADITAAARLTAKYGKGRNEPSVRVVVRRDEGGEPLELDVPPAADADAAATLIMRKQP